MRSHIRLAATAILALAALAACGGGSGSSSSAPADTTSTTVAGPLVPAEPSTTTMPAVSPLPSRWDAVLDGIGDEGEVSVELAVDAFSLGVAPLPGSQLRRADGDTTVPDASSAVSWIIRHFDELSPEQQAAVGAALSPPDASASVSEGASGFRRAAPPKIGCYGQVLATADSPDAGPYRAIADEVTAEIESRLGGAIQLVAPTYILLDHRDLGLGLGYTWADPGDCRDNGMATCTIHLSAEGEGEGPAGVRAIIAHEVMHCFQFQYLGMAANDMPAWILEGVPAWVGEDIAGGSTISTNWWGRYLSAPEASLYGRDYDAIGFYAHLAEVGTNPWTRIVQIFDGFSNEPAFEGAGASAGSFLDSWPSSTLRRADIGRAWDAVGPGITIDRATPTPMSVGNGGMATAEAAKVSGRLLDLTISADIVTIDFDGSVRIGAEGGTDQVLTARTTYCSRPGGCTCPDGRTSPYDPIAGRLVVGLTGGTSTASITVTGQELDCERATPPADIVDPCMVGDWVSTASYIDDTVTGAPVTELGGGAGIVMTIRKDGSFTMDFNGSTPSSTDLGDGLVLATRTRGVANGHITSANGQVTLVDQDYKTSLTTQLNTGGSLPGGTGIGSGTYSCSPSTVDFRTPFDLGETINAFRSA